MDLIEQLQKQPEIASVHAPRIDLAVPREYFLRDLWSLLLFEYHGAAEINGDRYALAPEYALLLPPGTRRRFELCGPSKHRAVHFHWNDSGKVRLYDCAGEAIRLRRDFDDMMGMRPAQPARANVRLWDMLWRLVDLPELPGNANTATHSALRKALQFIELHLAEAITIPEIANEAGFSHNHLTRLFKQHVDESPIRYIRQRRMEQAAHLLRFTNLPIKVIAAEVGLADLQKFNRTAHAVWGCSPSALREKGSPYPHRA